MNLRVTFKNLIILFGLLILGSCVSSIQQNNSLTIETSSGIVQGSLKQDVISWEDIPYAIPPEGDLRWKAPRSLIAPELVIQRQEGNGCYKKQVFMQAFKVRALLAKKIVCIWILEPL